MATVSQIPETVDVFLVVGDELSIPLTFSTDLSGYTITSGVYDASQLTPSDLLSPGLVVSTAGGQTSVLVSFVESDTSQLGASGNWRWYLRWVSPGGVTRTVISGAVRTQNP